MSDKNKKENKLPVNDQEPKEPVVGDDGLTDEERKALEEENGQGDAGGTNEPDENAKPSAEEVVDELEALPLEQLKGVAIGLGMSPAQTSKFTTKAPLIATIQLVRQTKVNVPQGAGVSADVNIDLDDLAKRDRKVVDADGNIVVKKAVRDDVNKDKKEFESRKDRIRKFLESQPKVKVFVPRDFGEKAGAVLPVTINGYRYSILKGVMVDVPQGVYEVIQNSLEMTDRAGQEFLLDRTKYDEELGQNVNVRDRL